MPGFRWLVTFLGALIGSAFAFVAYPGASTIEVSEGKLGTLIRITGTLQDADGDIFLAKVSAYPEATVSLHSDGGSVRAGLTIGYQIQSKKFSTVVEDGKRCASACALVWLGGSSRYMGPEAKIGFHAAYLLTGGKAVESGAANALIGAYLARLGLADRAIFYITKASPESMQWLTKADAKNLEITVLDWPGFPRVAQEKTSTLPASSPAPKTEPPRRRAVEPNGQCFRFNGKSICE